MKAVFRPGYVWLKIVRRDELETTHFHGKLWKVIPRKMIFGQRQAICNAQCYCHLKGTLLQMMPINLKPVCHGFFSLLGFFFYFSFTFLNSKTNVKFKNSIKVAQMDHYWTLLLSLVQL